MANRRMNQFQFSNLNAPVQIFFKVTFGATGAPTLASTNNGFISSVVRNSAGQYTITLVDAFNSLLGMDWAFIVSGAAPASPNMRVKTNSITSKSLVIVFDAAGVATDPASGEIVLLTIKASNSSV